MSITIALGLIENGFCYLTSYANILGYWAWNNENHVVFIDLLYSLK